MFSDINLVKTKATTRIHEIGILEDNNKGELVRNLGKRGTC